MILSLHIPLLWQVFVIHINFKWIHLNILKGGWVDFIIFLLVVYVVHGKFEWYVISMNIIIRKKEEYYNYYFKLIGV
jgi:hypothetical protein